MKYVRKMPQTDPELSARLENEGWVRIKEPKNLAMAVLFALPLAFLMLAITLGIAYALKPELFDFIRSGFFKINISLNFYTLLFIVSIFVYMFVHEMIHALFIPNFIKSDKTVWGMNGAFGFVSTTEAIGKGRFILISVMPFLILSIVALLFFKAIGFLNGYTLLLTLINAAGSCVDFLNVFLIAFQVKPGHSIINNGFETFYSPKKLQA